MDLPLTSLRKIKGSNIFIFPTLRSGFDLVIEVNVTSGPGVVDSMGVVISKTQKLDGKAAGGSLL